MIKFGIENKEMVFPPFHIKTVENQNNNVSFIISLALKGEPENVNNTGVNELDKILSGCSPIYPNRSKTYEIIFENYIIHMTRNESYTPWNETEIKHGNYLIIYENSNLLNNLNSFIDQDLTYAVYNKSCKHYSICCQDHIIDIITVHEPIIKPI